MWEKFHNVSFVTVSHSAKRSRAQVAERVKAEAELVAAAAANKAALVRRYPKRNVPKKNYREIEFGRPDEFFC